LSNASRVRAQCRLRAFISHSDNIVPMNKHE
jgi:hypothetical protein